MSLVIDIRPLGCMRRRPALADVAHRRDLCIGDRLAELVHDPAGDDSSARQREVDLLEQLAVGDLERLPLLERSELTVGKRHEAAFAGVERVAARGQLFELVASLGVRAGDASFTDLGRGGAHKRFAQRLTGIGSDHAAADHRGAGLRRRIARRRHSGCDSWRHGRRRWRLGLDGGRRHDQRRAE
jgi:hypothetical protein